MLQGKTPNELNEEVKSLRLVLKPTSKEGLQVGTKSDGKNYSVREHRMSFIFPEVWEKFMKSIKSKKAKLTFDILIQTGARINEVRNVKLADCDFERNTIRLRITKTKARKGETKGKP